MFKWFAFGFGLWWLMSKKSDAEKIKETDGLLYSYLFELSALVAKFKNGVQSEDDERRFKFLFDLIEKRLVYLNAILDVDSWSALKALLHAVYSESLAYASSWMEKNRKRSPWTRPEVHFLDPKELHQQRMVVVDLNQPRQKQDEYPNPLFASDEEIEAWRKRHYEQGGAIGRWGRY